MSGPSQPRIIRRPALEGRDLSSHFGQKTAHIACADPFRRIDRRTPRSIGIMAMLTLRFMARPCWIISCGGLISHRSNTRAAAPFAQSDHPQPQMRARPENGSGSSPETYSIRWRSMVWITRFRQTQRWRHTDSPSDRRRTKPWP
jgi:hypothetical protein